MLEGLRSYPLDGSLIDTWVVWDLIATLEEEATRPALKDIIKIFNHAYPDIHEHFHRHLAFVDLLCDERVDYLKRHETFLKLYAKYTNPEASLDVDSKIFEL